jgi:hypothetical protein
MHAWGKSKLNWGVSGATGGLLRWSGSTGGCRTPAIVVLARWAATVCGDRRKRTRWQGEAHRGTNRAVRPCSDAGVDVGGGVRAEVGRFSWRGHCRDAPGLWVAEIGPRSPCGGGQEARKAQNAPAMRNRIAAGHLPTVDQRRWRLPIRAMAHDAEAQGALGRLLRLGVGPRGACG